MDVLILYIWMYLYCRSGCTFTVDLDVLILWVNLFIWTDQHIALLSEKLLQFVPVTVHVTQTSIRNVGGVPSSGGSDTEI